MPNPDRWLTLNDVLRITSLARTTIYDLIREADFPQQVKIGSASRWSENDVVEWMTRKHAEHPSRRAAA
jgi:prophage regulatory protein